VFLKIREACPSDFYWQSWIKSEYPEMRDTEKVIRIIERLAEVEEGALDDLPLAAATSIYQWIAKEGIYVEMPLHLWLQNVAGLTKSNWAEYQRFDQTPWSMIQAMIDTHNEMVKKAEMKTPSGKK